MAFLIQVNEGVKSVVLPLGKAVILIGRDVKSNLYLDASGISPDHASIIFSNETYTLKDNGSNSGTFVNGERVTEHRLSHDDVIQFGPYHFKVDLKNPTPVTTSAARHVRREPHSRVERLKPGRTRVTRRRQRQWSCAAAKPAQVGVGRAPRWYAM